MCVWVIVSVFFFLLKIEKEKKRKKKRIFQWNKMRKDDYFHTHFFSLNFPLLFLLLISIKHFHLPLVTRFLSNMKDIWKLMMIRVSECFTVALQLPFFFLCLQFFHLNVSIHSVYRAFIARFIPWREFNEILSCT